MTERATFSLDEEAYAFLQAVGGDNKSAYINDLLKRERLKTLQDAVLKANEEEADDTYQNDLTEWDVTLSDGLQP